MAKEVTGLVDQYGRPILREVLTQRIAAATLTGVRQAVAAEISRGLDPRRLGAIFRAAKEHNPEALMELAEEIEEKDMHYVSVLGTRKRQVAQLDITIDAGSDDARADQISTDIKTALIDSDVIAEYLFDMLDAIGKGYSLGELIWTTSAKQWSIDRIERVDPRFIRFDFATMSIPMLLGDDGTRVPLAPYKFAFLQLKAKSGIPTRGGLVWPAAWTYLFKNFTLKDWIQFCDVYGLPLRVGKYPPGASEDDQNALMRAVAGIAQDAAGIIPENMSIEFVEAANKGGSADFFEKLIKYCDDLASKAVLGQTGTTDSTPGKLGNQQDHTMVREDIERADAKAIATVINRQIVRPFVDLNYGPQEVYPKIKVGRADEKDAALIIDAVEKLVPLGFRVGQGQVRTILGISEPDPEDEVFSNAASPAPGELGSRQPGGGPAPALQALLKGTQPAQIASRLAIALAAQQQQQDAIDRAAAQMLGDWEEVVSEPMRQIVAVAHASSSLIDFKERLAKLYPSIDMSALTDTLATATFQAFAAGYVGDGV